MGTLVIESFAVDVPEGNTKDETCYFVEAPIKCNLKSLADISQRLAVQDTTGGSPWTERFGCRWMKLSKGKERESLFEDDGQGK